MTFLLLFDCPQPEWKEQAGSVYVTFKPAAWFEKQRETAPATGQVTGQVAVTALELCQEPRKAVEVQTALGIKHRQTFRENYLTPLLETGWIERTIPDKPQSRLQRYRITEKGRAWLAGQLK